MASGIYQDADGSFHSPAGGAGLGGAPGIEADCGRVLELLKRRPCTVRDIAEGLDLNINEAAKFVGGFSREKDLSAPSAEKDGPISSPTMETEPLRAHFCAQIIDICS